MSSRHVNGRFSNIALNRILSQIIQHYVNFLFLFYNCTIIIYCIITWHVFFINTLNFIKWTLLIFLIIDPEEIFKINLIYLKVILILFYVLQLGV